MTVKELRAKHADLVRRYDSAAPMSQAEVQRNLEERATIEKQIAAMESGEPAPPEAVPPPRARYTDAVIERELKGHLEIFASMKKYVDRGFDEVEGVVKEIGKRLKALETRPEFADAGVYDHGKSYAAGSGVTDEGSYWIAKRAAGVGEAPGQCDAWRLAVKRGRDGRVR